MNGVVAKTISKPAQRRLNETHFVKELDETITVEDSGWIAVRVFEARTDHRIRFAHTAPVFVDRPGKPLAPFKDEVDHFIERIEREIKRNRGVLSADALDEYEEALTIYRDLAGRAIERPVPADTK